MATNKPETEKSEAKLLEEQLTRKKESVYKSFCSEADDAVRAYCDEYIAALNAGKTEREFAKESVAYLEAHGFKPFDPKATPKAGDRVYWNNRGKSIVAAVIGSAPLEQGVRIAAAHIDSPRLDLKPIPLYEDKELGFFKTHYYGGIKKYQWVAIPLALHGTVVKKDGTAVDIVIGEADTDPVLCITDLLPHLSGKAQNDRKATEVIKGEELNVLLGSVPYGDDSVKEKVKLNILRLLNERYGITEDDFISAELEVVPAFKARYLGLDESLIGSYGHDDRVCGYTALTALGSISGTPDVTAVCILADKEETGSNGNTGLNSDMLYSFLSLISRRMGADVELVLGASKCLSADVNAAFDPSFPQVMEPNNASYINYGPVITKYTGSRGKGGTNDASAEWMAEVRAILDASGVPWQTGELGKVDEGGGGTVAMYISALGVDVVDVGVALLSMHAPYEVASCLDVYAMYKAFCAFYN